MPADLPPEPTSTARLIEAFFDWAGQGQYTPKEVTAGLVGRRSLSSVREVLERLHSSGHLQRVDRVRGGYVYQRSTDWSPPHKGIWSERE